MSLLPNVANAVVEDSKITDYMLDPGHSIGGPKAAFFAAFGLNLNNWAYLKASLLRHPAVNAVSGQQSTGYGEKYEVTCSLSTPDGRNPCVVSVWIIEPRRPDDAATCDRLSGALIAEMPTTR